MSSVLHELEVYSDGPFARNEIGHAGRLLAESGMNVGDSARWQHQSGVTYFISFHRELRPFMILFIFINLIFDSNSLSILLSLLWGCIIFNLDRYIVSSIRMNENNWKGGQSPVLADKDNFGVFTCCFFTLGKLSFETRFSEFMFGTMVAEMDRR